MPKRKPASQFELRFDRRDVFPENIAFAALADAVGAVQRLAAGDVPDAEIERVSVCLLDVGRGSAAFRLITNDPELAARNLRFAADAIVSCHLDEQAAFTVHPIRELSRIARKYDCPIDLWHSEQGQGPLFRIVPETYELLARSALSHGDATTAAYVARVGGATEPRCVLRIPGQGRVLFCSLGSEELARKLARLLYQWALVSGKATWLRQSQRIVRMAVTSFRPFPRGTLQEGFREIRKAGGSAWDRIPDVRQYLTEVTGD